MNSPPARPTPALEAYQANRRQLDAYIQMLTREIMPIPEDLHSEIQGHWRQEAKRREDAGETVDRADLQNAAKTKFDGMLIVTRWIPVILVTLGETYLQDALLYTEEHNPHRVRKCERTDPPVRYAELAERGSAAILEEMRETWVRNFMDKGRPLLWAEKLWSESERRQFALLLTNLEELSLSRNLIVHRAGVIDIDYVTALRELDPANFPPESRSSWKGMPLRIARHGDLGEQIYFRRSELEEWAKEVDKFVEITEQHMQGSLAAPR